jgi:hypothetical protein
MFLKNGLLLPAGFVEEAGVGTKPSLAAMKSREAGFPEEPVIRD